MMMSRKIIMLGINHFSSRYLYFNLKITVWVIKYGYILLTYSNKKIKSKLLVFMNSWYNYVWYTQFGSY